MKSKSLNHIFKKYFAIIIFAINLSFALVLGFFIRENKISQVKNNLKTEVFQNSNRIHSKLNKNFEKVNFLVDILKSQLNSNRAYFQYNSLFSQTLSSDESLTNIFVVFSKYAKIKDPDFFNYLDSIGRINISWDKNTKGVIDIDTFNSFANSKIYDYVKSVGSITVFNAFEISEDIQKSMLKTFAFPIYQGTNFVGIIGFTVNTSFITNILSSNEFSDYFYVSDEDGILLFDKNSRINIGKPFTVITNTNFSHYEQDIVHNTGIETFSKNEFLLFEPLNLDFIDDFWKIGIIIPSYKITMQANIYFFLLIFIFVVLSIIESFIFNKIINNSFRFFDNFNNKIKKLTSGDLKDNLNIDTEYSEIKEFTQNVEYLRLRLLDLVEIHSQIEQQYITKKLEYKSENDILAKSINDAVESIKERAYSKQEAFDSKQRNEWINEGLNLIHEASKIEENSIEKLADKINEKITIFTDAFICTIFIKNDDIDNKTQYLEAVSTYGIQTKRAFKKRILFGEGVVGTVALERKTQYFDKIPDDYHIIIGGLGQMNPKSILIQPLEYENEFLGILEIAFLKKLKEHEIRFFQSASHEIALSIKNIMNNISRNSLLEKMRNQTKEIENAQKLLESKIKELKIKEKEVEENNAVLQTYINAVNNTLMTIEYTTDGILLTANQKYLKTMNYSIDEIKGVNVLDLVKSERAELNDVIRKVSAGDHYDKIMKRYTKYGEEKWLYSTYTPYYDINGKITKILYFAFDVTKTKKYTEKLEKELSVLKKQIKILRERL